MKNDPRRLLCALTLVAAAALKGSPSLAGSGAVPGFAQTSGFQLNNADAARIALGILGELTRGSAPSVGNVREHYPPRRDDRRRPLPPEPDYGHQRPSYGSPIERLRDVARGLQDAAASWQRAPSGSFEERFAGRRMDDLMDEARGVMSSGCLSDANVEELEAFAQEAASGWQRASSGSRLESFWALVQSGVGDSALVALERKVRDAGEDFKCLEQLGLRYSQLWQSASSGSRLETYYGRARGVAFDGALRALECWLNARRPSYSELERVGMDFDFGYRRASSGSAAERFYKQAGDLILANMGSSRRRY